MGFGVRYAYAILIFVGIVLLLFQGVRLTEIRSKVLLLSYLYSLLLIALIHGVFITQSLRILTGYLIYSLIPIYWALYFCNHKYEGLDKLINMSIPVFYVIGALGAIQFFYSPLLFGFITASSNSIEWASNASFEIYSVYFRATSTLGSPQVYGLFMALAIVLVHSRSRGRGLYFYAGLSFLFFCGLLSGNKSFLLTLFLYFSWEALTSSISVWKKIIGFSLLVLSGVLILFFVADYIPVLERLISLDADLFQGGGDARIDRYLEIINRANPLIGNGIGELTNRSVEGIRASESHFLKMYYEAGVLVLSLFVLTLTFALINAIRMGRSDAIAIVFLSMISMVIVHAYDSPVFFIFWGIIISNLTSEGTNRAPNYASNV